MTSETTPEQSSASVLVADAMHSQGFDTTYVAQLINRAHTELTPYGLDEDPSFLLFYAGLYHEFSASSGNRKEQEKLTKRTYDLVGEFIPGGPSIMKYRNQLVVASLYVAAPDRFEAAGITQSNITAFVNSDFSIKEGVGFIREMLSHIPEELTLELSEIMPSAGETVEYLLRTFTHASEDEIEKIKVAAEARPSTIIDLSRVNKSYDQLIDTIGELANIPWKRREKLGLIAITNGTIICYYNIGEMREHYAHEDFHIKGTLELGFLGEALTEGLTDHLGLTRHILRYKDTTWHTAVFLDAMKEPIIRPPYPVYQNERKLIDRILRDDNGEIDPHGYKLMLKAYFIDDEKVIFDWHKYLLEKFGLKKYVELYLAIELSSQSKKTTRHLIPTTSVLQSITPES